MFINYEMSTIELTKSEAKEAGKYGSEMYLQLTEAKAATGLTKIVVKESKRKSDTMKGLTYTYMEVYIKTKSGDKEDSLMKEFNELRGCVDGKRDILKEKATYGEVKAWFLEQFEEIKQFNNGLNEKRENLRKTRKINRIKSLIA